MFPKKPGKPGIFTPIQPKRRKSEEKEGVFTSPLSMAHQGPVSKAKMMTVEQIHDAKTGSEAKPVIAAISVMTGVAAVWMGSFLGVFNPGWTAIFRWAGLQTGRQAMGGL